MDIDGASRKGVTFEELDEEEDEKQYVLKECSVAQYSLSSF